ncbi:MAG: O-antigen ligase family protein, partial [Parcubacteria group bacterium]|nr:O-antigen ligase family protein [Parcubacteria group bacterium]
MNLALIIILFVIFAIISFKRLDWSLYLIIFLLPTYLIRFRVGPIPLTFLEGMILVLFLTWVIKEIKNKNLFKIIKNLPQCRFFIPMILLLLASTISLFVSFNFNAAAGIWKAYFIEPLLLFLVFINTIKSKDQINKVIWSLGLSAFIVSLIAITQYLTDFAIPASYNLPNIKRATSIYGYPSAIGLYVAPILTLLIGYFILKYKNINSKIKSVLLFAIIILAISLFFARTEGSMIAIFVATFFIFMFTKWRWWIISGSIAVGLLLLIIPQSRDYLITLLTFRDVSGDVRITLWHGTLRLIKNHPIFGAGLAGFPYLYEQYN